MNTPAKIVSLIALGCVDRSLPAVLHRRDRPGRREVDSAGRHHRLVHRHADVDEPQIAGGCDRSRDLVSRVATSPDVMPSTSQEV